VARPSDWLSTTGMKRVAVAADSTYKANDSPLPSGLIGTVELDSLSPTEWIMSVARDSSRWMKFVDHPSHLSNYLVLVIVGRTFRYPTGVSKLQGR
jgi:hypothetical protein